MNRLPRGSLPLNVFDDVSAPCAWLAGREPTLARALGPIGAPYIRRRDGGFEGLFRIIVEQQVSVPSAQAIWGRCLNALQPLTAERILAAGEEALKACGLSAPKARYVSTLAKALQNGVLNLEALAAAPNDEALEILQSVKGIGPWSAAIYLLFCEGRVDIWPPKDVALKAAYNAAKPRKPHLDQITLDERSVRWAPYRGLAAHILWTYYAQIRGRTPI